MPLVMYLPMGRTGNNLFQYFAAEIINKIFNFDGVSIDNFDTQEYLEINDVQYSNIINEYLESGSISFCKTKNLLLNGFFQDAKPLIHFRDFILSIFTESNHTIFSTTRSVKLENILKISDIISYKSKYPEILSTDLAVHLRLDDYLHNNSPPNIIDKEFLGTIITSISYTKLYIVCEIPKQKWEIDYINYFKETFNAEVLNGTLLDDFIFLKSANKIITSPSTFCWLAAFLGSADEIHIPYTDYYKSLQKLDKINSKTTVYRNVPFAKITV